MLTDSAGVAGLTTIYPGRYRGRCVHIQVKVHEEAVALFTAYAKGGDDPQLKKWAAKTLPNLEQHFTMAQKLK